MKTRPFFQSLTQPMTRWCQRYKGLRRLHLGKTADKVLQRKQITSTLVTTSKVKNRILVKSCRYLPRGTPLMVVLALVSLTGVMGHRFYNQPQLQVGSIAPQTIQALTTATIEDTEKTHRQRQSASQQSIPVLMVDEQISQETNQNLQQLLNLGLEIHTSAGGYPYFDNFVLSLPSQNFLRSMPNAEWRTFLQKVENADKQKLGLAPIKTPDQKSVDYFQDPQFNQALVELEAYHITTSDQTFSLVLAQISRVRQKYAQAKTKLSQLSADDSQVIYDASFLDLSDDDWQKTQSGIQQSAQRILTQGIPPGLPRKILEAAVNLQIEQSLIPKPAQPIAARLLLSVLQQPNLKEDKIQTKIRQLKAAADVQPVMVEVRKGQVIVRKGETITKWKFEELEHYHLIRREINVRGLITLGSATILAISIFAVVERRVVQRVRQRDRLLILLLTLTIPVIILATPYTPWSAVGLLLGSFYGSILSVTVLGLLLVLLPIGLEISKVTLVAGAAGGILGSCLAKRLRSREELAILGVGIALTEGGVYFILKLLAGAVTGTAWYSIFPEAGLFALSGLAWSVVALGLSPYLEKFFDLVTPIRLAELANPNRLLLKRLATEAPGTFQHTLFVSTLAEAAAKKLKCNVELVRAGTLYHDIGKMHDPQAFIENQMGGSNKHDTEIQDPWKSACIIKKHVSEGLVMGRKYTLPTAIQAFIPEHQGTMLIAYFYHQALQIAQDHPEIKVNEADFRYDGPIPQSRETAILMLADSCEAALRSLKDATYEQALSMVNNILRGKWQDHQMQDSQLTREEMSEIAEIFVEVWQQFHHKRIAYPKLNTPRK